MNAVEIDDNLDNLYKRVIIREINIFNECLEQLIRQSNLGRNDKYELTIREALQKHYKTHKMMWLNDTIYKLHQDLKKSKLTRSIKRCKSI
jgi:uncharacterized HAD superfamily protein